jgi:hypothetical protein
MRKIMEHFILQWQHILLQEGATLMVLSIPLVAIAQSNGWLCTQFTTAPTQLHHQALLLI